MTYWLAHLNALPMGMILDHLAVVIFALTGALTASRQQLDIVGFIFLACLTALGGGTLRDLLIGRDPLWLAQPSFVLIASAAALVVFLTAHLLESRYRTLLWLDACALAAAVPAGVAVTQALGHGPVVVVIMGVLTACAGGLARDIVCNEIPLVLKQGELYLSCAFAGALASLIAQALGMDQFLSLLLCALVTLTLRAGSLRYGWRLPVYKPRPKRDY